jgi:protein arginine N-methyltransferase 1
MRIEYHRTLLADAVRNAAFDRALARLVVPGQTVVADIGAGTGIMGFLALKHGARRVYAYESQGVLEVARRIAKRNGIRNWEPVPASSLEIIDPPRVDLVVSETLGNYPFEEDIVATLEDAKRRHLAPGGTILPNLIEQFACPVLGERHWQELASWDRVGLGLDFTSAKIMSLNNIYVRWMAPEDLLDGGRAALVWDRADLTARCKSTRTGEGKWTFAAPARVTGLAIWWRVRLTEDVFLATGPLDPRTHWEQLFLPAPEPLAFAGGDQLEARIRSTTSPEKGTDVAWTLTHRDARGRERARHAMSLDKGYLP